MLVVSEQLEPTPQYRCGRDLARVLSRGPALPAAVHQKGHVQPVRRLPGEWLPRLRAQLVRDHVGKGPGEYGQPARAGGTHGGPGDCAVIGVAGDAGLVEDKQAIGAMAGEGLQYLGGKFGLWNGGQAAVAIVKQVDAGHAEHGARLPQLALPHTMQARADLIQGRCLAAGIAKNAYLRAGSGQQVDDGTEAKRLVVRMGHHDQDARP